MGLAGLGLIGIMTLSFVGAFRPAVDAGTSMVFWGCAAGVLGIIIYNSKFKGSPKGGKDTENA